MELSQHVKYFLHGFGVLILDLLHPLWCSSMLLQSHCPSDKMWGGGRNMWFGWLGIRTNKRPYLKNCESKTSIRGFLLTFTFVLWHKDSRTWIWAHFMSKYMYREKNKFNTENDFFKHLHHYNLDKRCLIRQK